MKTALVIGGTHGIGLEIAKQFEESGYIVYVCARGINEPTAGYFIKCDVLNSSDVNNVIKLLPEVDILVCSTGGGGSWGNDKWNETVYHVWETVYEKNVGYIVKLMNHYLPSMIKNKWGRVITISSNRGKESFDDGKPWFQIAKTAQISLIKSYSRNKNFVRNGITFNTISPGPIFIEDTYWDKMKNENSDLYEKYIELTPMGRIGSPADVANVVSFLCSEKANYINGVNIEVDGGESHGF